jgi:hypothetical protein
VVGDRPRPAATRQGAAFEVLGTDPRLR